MTCQEFVALSLENNPTFTRKQRVFVKITSPILVKLVNHEVKARMDQIVTNLDREIAKTK